MKLCYPTLCIFFLFLVLTACSFQLRANTPLPFASISLGFLPDSALGMTLKHQIQSDRKTRIVTHDAEVNFIVLSESRDKQVLTINSRGSVREYLLNYTLTFRLLNAQQQEILPPTTISLKRNANYNETEELSTLAKEELLYKDMQMDMAQQILRQLAAVKLHKTSQIH